MNYELAKQLKDAGFPQDARHFYWNDLTTPVTRWCINALELRDPYVPSKHLTADSTLSELIEACGENFYDFRRCEGFHGKQWSAGTLFTPISTQIVSTGSTPEEAVAKLWLALRTK